MNPLKLFDPKYLFDPHPGYNFAYFWPLIIFYALIFIASFYSKTYIKKLPNQEAAMEFLGQIPKRMREFAVIGLILAFFRDQDIPYFGMRVFTVILLASGLAYCIYVFRKYKLNINTRVQKIEEKKTTDKYLPKPKKRR